MSLRGDLFYMERTFANTPFLCPMGDVNCAPRSSDDLRPSRDYNVSCLLQEGHEDGKKKVAFLENK